ncbi:2Fe-2S iron-sulfur cluster binding domain-containing protein [Nibribacter ruber]|uniref:2Fe-2S iron-sulfur cluster binding domain-containing protein n=1 Tax=Nibribacter ruber TaxID=2698458 RepID=A0A6P1NXT9_9BACT|nr:ferredoxin--NADP reductase [Nibribacter ruber]QHL86748.1 2Fe-2S iron-sulfur cluster binding domain-containing protein [Nibribacter ruber]
MNSPYIPLTISRIREEVPGVKTFEFSGPESSQIAYLAGQYLTLVLPAQPHRAEIRRSYSITSSPDLQEPLAIGVKRLSNGAFSRYLVDHAKVGDQVLTIGAAGFFTLPEELSTVGQLFFFAAGSGITPIFSLLKTVLAAHAPLPVVLVYSNQTERLTIYKKELLALQKAFPERFHMRLLYSDAPKLDQARLHKNLLEKLVKEMALVPPEQLLAYVCGPENYMRMCTYGLRGAQVPFENIRKETFSTQKVHLKATPPDKDRHKIELVWQKETHHFWAQYPDTILQAAQKAGISLPYSCEVGKCGNCAARCAQGQVWMSYNEVLTQKKLDQGYVLTCVGHPVGGDVTLEL